MPFPELALFPRRGIGAARERSRQATDTSQLGVVRCKVCEKPFDVMCLPTSDYFTRKTETGLPRHDVDAVLVRCPHCEVHQ